MADRGEYLFPDFGGHYQPSVWALWQSYDYYDYDGGIVFALMTTVGFSCASLISAKHDPLLCWRIFCLSAKQKGILRQTLPKRYFALISCDCRVGGVIGLVQTFAAYRPRFACYLWLELCWFSVCYVVADGRLCETDLSTRKWSIRVDLSPNYKVNRHIFWMLHFRIFLCAK